MVGQIGAIIAIIYSYPSKSNRIAPKQATVIEEYALSGCTQNDFYTLFLSPFSLKKGLKVRGKSGT